MGAGRRPSPTPLQTRGAFDNVCRVEILLSLIGLGQPVNLVLKAITVSTLDPVPVSRIDQFILNR
jgi:hypothetical protein